MVPSTAHCLVRIAARCGVAHAAGAEQRQGLMMHAFGAKQRIAQTRRDTVAD